MTNNIFEQLQRKRMYINAGKSVMEHNLQHFGRYTDYALVDQLVNEIKSSQNSIIVYLNDKIGTFFDILCNKLLNEVYKNELVFITLSQFYHSDIICQLLIPDKNCVLTNIHHNGTCKVSKLYTNDLTKNSGYNYNIACEYFKLSEKI